MLPAIFEIQVCRESEKSRYASNDLRMTLKPKLPCKEQIIAQQAQLLGCFALRPSVSEIRFFRKSEKAGMQRMTSDWPYTLNSQKYPVYSKYLPIRPQICSFWPAISKYRRLYVKRPKQAQKSCPKSKISNLQPWQRRSKHESGGVNLVWRLFNNKIHSYLAPALQIPHASKHTAAWNAFYCRTKKS